MIETIEKRICDICNKEVKEFAGSLILKYADSDHTGCSFPVKIEKKEICIDCCRELEKIIIQVLRGKSIYGDNSSE